MIFYFTGTGNSLYAAQQLAREGERVVSMIDAVRAREFHCTLAPGEALGFVFPVYFYTVSDPVLELVRNLTVENADFVYAVIPCGASIGPAGGFLKSELKKRGLELQRVDPLVVPDGALIFYDIDAPSRCSRCSSTPRQKSSPPSGMPSSAGSRTASPEAPRRGRRDWPLTTSA